MLLVRANCLFNVYDCHEGMLAGFLPHCTHRCHIIDNEHTIIITFHLAASTHDDLYGNEQFHHHLADLHYFDLRIQCYFVS